MSKHFIKIIFVIVFPFLLVSCKNTKQKIQEFVGSYNHAAVLFRNDVITSTSAKAFLKDNKIEVRFETNLEQNESNKSSYGLIFPDMMMTMLKKDKVFIELIDEGVTFDMYFLANNYDILAQFKVDKKELEELLKMDSINSDKKIVNSHSNLDPMLQEMLAIINAKAPIKREDGTKILKIDANEKNELVFKIEIPNEFVESMKGEASKIVLKDDILRNPNLKNIISKVKDYGIVNVIFEYKNTKGELINTVVLNEKDFK
jgi:hypothetical protein